MSKGASYVAVGAKVLAHGELFAATTLGTVVFSY